jgi:hypothetical protein
MSKQKKKEKLGGKCAHCGTKDDLTLDHILPVQLMYILNVKIPESRNFQVLCERCNKKKGNHLQTNHPETAKLLNEAIATWNTLNAPPRKVRNYVFRNLPVVSLTPNPTHFVPEKKLLKAIYLKQKTGKEWLEGEMYGLI